MSQDYIALEWVKGEIQETLQQAQQSLEAYGENPQDKSRLKFCFSYLHQVRGTLQMVEFFGAALLAEEMEAVAEALAEGALSNERDGLQVLMQAIIQLPHYLDHVKVGRRDLPIILLPILNELRSARGEALLSETALFSPRMVRKAVLRTDQLKRFRTEEFQQWIRKVRQMYQTATLQLFQGKNPDVAKDYLHKVFGRLHNALGNTPNGVIWQPAMAFAEWLAGQRSVPASAKQHLRDIDLMLKALIVEGADVLNHPAQDELVKNLLFYVARTKVKGDAIRAVQELFSLESALPSEAEIQKEREALAGPDRATISQVLSALIEEITAIKDKLDLAVRDGGSRLALLQEVQPSAKQVCDTMAMLGLGMPRDVIQEQLNLISNMVSTGDSRDQQLMDVAGALLYVEATLANMIREGKLDSQVAAGSLSEEQKAVLREARNALEQVKDAIVAYVANQWNARELASVPYLLRSIAGSLGMVPLNSVSVLLRQTAPFVEDLIANNVRIDWATLDNFADVLSGVEYYLERYSENPHNAGDDILVRANTSLACLPGIELLPEPAVVEDEPDVIHADDTVASVPAASETAVEVPDVAVEVKAQSDHERDENTIIATGSAVAEPEPEVPVAEITPAAVPEPVAAPTPVTPEPVAVPAPAVAAPVMEEETDDLIDDEIIEIFLEEAEEVTATLDEYWPQFRANTSNTEAMTTVRRAFHTLKGSGRMVRAMVIGELAWSIENMFNRVIDKTITVSDNMLDIVEHVLGNLPVLIDDFRCRRSPSLDTQPLMDYAFAIAEGKSVPPIDEMLKVSEPVVSDAGMSYPGRESVTQAAAGDTESDNEEDDRSSCSQADDESVADTTDTPEVLPVSAEASVEEAVAPGIPEESLNIHAADIVDSALDRVGKADDRITSADLAAGYDQDDLEDAIALLDVFVQEAKGHLEVVNAFVAESIEANYDNPLGDQVQRALHTLKGSAHMAGIAAIANLASPLERLLKEFRAYQIGNSKDLVDLVSDGAGMIASGLRDKARLHSGMIGGLQTYLRRVDLLERTLLLPVIEDAERSENVPNPQAISQFLAQGMDSLLDAEQLIRRWETMGDESVLESLCSDLKAVATGAEQAEQLRITEMCSALYELYREILVTEEHPRQEWLTLALQGQEELLNMMDCLAAGQVLEVPEVLESIRAVANQLSVENLLKEPAPVASEEEGLNALNALLDNVDDESPDNIFAALLDEDVDEGNQDADDSRSDPDPDEDETVTAIAAPARHWSESVYDSPENDINSLLSSLQEPSSVTDADEEIPLVDIRSEDVADESGDEVDDHLQIDLTDVPVVSDELVRDESAQDNGSVDDIPLILDLMVDDPQQPQSVPEDIAALDQEPYILDLNDTVHADNQEFDVQWQSESQIPVLSDVSADVPVLDEKTPSAHLQTEIILNLDDEASDSLTGVSSDSVDSVSNQTDSGFDFDIDMTLPVETLPSAETGIEEVAATPAESVELQLPVEDASLIDSLTLVYDEPLVEETYTEAQPDEELSFDISAYEEPLAEELPLEELPVEEPSPDNLPIVGEIPPVDDVSLSDDSEMSFDYSVLPDEPVSGEYRLSASDLIARPEVEPEPDAEDQDLAVTFDESSQEYIPAPVVEESLAQDFGMTPASQQEDDDVDEILEIFLEEAQEIIESVESTLNQWREDPNNLVSVARLQRDLHTLKGGARMAEQPAVAELCHELETLYERINNGRLGIEPGLFNLLQAAHDDLGGQIDAIQEGMHPATAASIMSSLSSYMKGEHFGGMEQALVRDEPMLDVAENTVTDVEETAAVEPVVAVQAEQLHSEPLDESDREILDIFLEEALELQEALEKTLHEWKSEPQGRDAPAEAQRVLHTLKGGARLAGLMDLGDIAHDFETDITQVMLGNKEMDNHFFDLAYQRQDAIVRRIDEIGKMMASGDLLVLNSSSLQTTGHDTNPPLPDMTAPAQPVAEIERPSKSNVVNLRPQAEVQVPAVVEAENLPAAAALSLPDPMANRKAPQELVKVSADLLDDLVNLAGETSIGRGRLEQQVTDFSNTLEEMEMTLDRLRDQLRRLDIETEAQVLFRQERQGPEYEDFDPLEMDRYSTIQQLSRALVESASDLLDLKTTLSNKTRDAETLLLQQSRVNTELQEGLMKTRMVPFQRLVPRLRRIVRQISQELDKQIDFRVVNAEGEMDRTILERMISPLEHMVRNAVDHGIEIPSVRARNGKSEIGTIELAVSREGGDVVLTLSDDGRGVNRQAVRNKAIERGLIDEHSQVNDFDLMQFILQAGFSTARNVTQISGRGVGLDVVSTEIKQMGGSVEIESEEGKGTRFVVRLPFTVSVNRALMVRLGDDLYAVPLNNIQGIVRASVNDLQEYYSKPRADRGYRYSNRDYRLEYLGVMLENESQPKIAAQNLPLPVLLVNGVVPHALQVDSVLGSREIVVKALGPQFAAVMGVSGGTILGDGSVVIILDLPAMIRAQASLEYQQAKLLDNRLAEQRQEKSKRQARVLVVDDSVTVRKVTSRLLERNGFEVLTASDGVDAMATLQDHKPDLMLLDIEMPRMDGFEVASLVRHDSRLQDIPIIMITSRTGDKHRERAMSIGVNEYMGKPFQEDKLLAGINRLLGREDN
jgi:chemosensory pili system protein ChpA (sensor histidine kinase/response regulator)